LSLDCPGIQLLGESLSKYCDPRVRAALRTLLGSGSPLTARQIAEKSGLGSIDDVMEKLSGILKISGITYRAVASSTGDSEFLARLSCPFCGSQDLRRDELVEHTACGYVGRLSEFKSGDGSMHCPRCKAAVDQGSLRSIGFWYQCNNCHQTFPRPNLSLVGVKSGKEISPEQLEPVKDVSYAVSEEVKGALSRLLELLDELEGSASSKGYRSTGPFRLRGKSGVEHEFCSGLDGGGSRILMDLVLCSDSSKILRHVTKAFDASSELPVVLLVAPDVNDPALKMLIAAALPELRVRVVTSNDPAQLPELLARALEAGFPREASSDAAVRSS
jgi:predicted Zn-ribbon and HTH transcriptional regulator